MYIELTDEIITAAVKKIDDLKDKILKREDASNTDKALVLLTHFMINNGGKDTLIKLKENGLHTMYIEI